MSSVIPDEGRLSARENARLVVELEERERTSAERTEANRIWRALMLARDLETCEALLRGETVPRSRLRQEWFERFDLR